METKIESGIYRSEDGKNLFVIFGGKIKVALGSTDVGYCISLQELKEHNEDWDEDRLTFNLVINNIKSIQVLRDALDVIEDKLNKE